MPQALSAEQIREAERMVQMRMAKDPVFSEKMRNGSIKFVVVPGEKRSGIGIVDMTNPENIKKYGGSKMFDTPQEAEHFTAGYGNEPTRRGNVLDMMKRAFIPHSQYQLHDPLRNYVHSPEADMFQDLINIGRYATPFLPIGPAKIGALNLGLGVGGNIVGDISGDSELQETVPNILANAATASLAAAGNKYYSKKATQERHLQDQLEQQLGYQKRPMFSKSPIEPELIDEARQVLEGGNVYTLGDWRNAPLDRFYNKIGTRALPMRMDFIPNVHEPTSKIDPKTKVHSTSAKIAPKSKMPKWSAQQWDAVSRKFMSDVGITNADPNEVREFLEEAYFRPQSKLGAMFYAKGGLPKDFTTSDWAAFRATDGNKFAKELLANKSHVIDEDLDKQRAQALDQRRERYNRLKTKTDKTGLVQPKDYRNMGDYSVRIPFVRRGGKPVELPRGRLVAQGAATLLPLAAQATLPYVIKWIGEDDE